MHYPKMILTAILVVSGTWLPDSAFAQENKSAKSNNPADTFVGRVLDAPINTLPTSDKFWWSDDWYDNGILPTPKNFQVVEETVSYLNPIDDTDVPAIIYRPKKEGKYPAVLFQHGRRGLDELAQRLARRMAARGFVVLAPNVFAARFIDRWPIEHMEETEGDVNARGRLSPGARRHIHIQNMPVFSHPWWLLHDESRNQIQTPRK